MRNFGRAGLTGLVILWGLQIPAAAQSDSSPPAAARTAKLAVISNFSARCPELKRADADEEAIAIVVFRVEVTGLPSQASIRSSSHSAALDDAATTCIMRLRFQPATSPGSGDAVASWQQLALRWLRSSAHTADSGLTPAASSIPAPAPAAADPHATQTGGARADVSVCVDGDGKLAQQPRVVRSSGDASFDAAALRIAQSGSGSYRPAKSPASVSPSACEPLTLSIEQR